MDNQPNPQYEALRPYISAFKQMFLTEEGKKVSEYLNAVNDIGSWEPGTHHDDMIHKEGQRAMCRQLLNFRNLTEE